MTVLRLQRQKTDFWNKFRQKGDSIKTGFPGSRLTKLKLLILNWHSTNEELLCKKYKTLIFGLVNLNSVMSQRSASPEIKQWGVGILMHCFKTLIWCRVLISSRLYYLNYFRRRPTLSILLLLFSPISGAPNHCSGNHKCPEKIKFINIL